MPYMTTRKTATAALCWNAFPEPPPEAENWSPDPNLIARPGALKDARFNKDPYAEQKRAALKREARMRGLNGYAARSLSSTSSSSAATTRAAAAGWPMQESRTCMPQDLALEPTSTRTAPATAADDTSTSTDANASIETGGCEGRTARPISQGHPLQSSSTSLSAAAAAAPSVPGRRNTKLAPTSVRTPLLPAAEYASLTGGNNSIPAWTGPLEKLLELNTLQRPRPPVQQAGKSIPPHLRKSAPTAGRVADNQNRDSGDGYSKLAGKDLDAHFQAVQQASRRVSGKSATEMFADEEDTMSDSALAWRLATTDLGIDNAKQALELQRAHFSEQNKGQCVFRDAHEIVVREHQRLIDTKLIRVLEDELDVPRSATKAELVAMNDEEFDNYLIKVKSAHQNWWVAEQRAHG
ncbi:hypothetical protein EK21DRAFT_87341 [Setomelanomma holmii]|uniref:Uncharacterized protein n=1 Tax=Setomelanomma holmii TaxID=210430 RepID=A0A9P4HDV6_9PLEO|nr:hypothetical protein EK21DRAFT_87341 [Setomelanomma holmii]